MRASLVPLLLMAGLIAACGDEAPESPSAAATTDATAARVEASATACKLARVQYGKLVQAYRIRHDRYPHGLDDLKAAGMIQTVIPCGAGGTYSVDERGAVVCSVHGK